MSGALRVVGAAVIGTAIGGGAKRVLPELLPHGLPRASALPLWDTARWAVSAIPTVHPTAGQLAAGMLAIAGVVVATRLAFVAEPSLQPSRESSRAPSSESPAPVVLSAGSPKPDAAAAVRAADRQARARTTASADRPGPLRRGLALLRTRRPASARRSPASAPAAALVPPLAATGVSRAEIARRTGLSRDAVALSLNLAARQV